MKHCLFPLWSRRSPILVVAIAMGVVVLVFSTLPGFDFWNCYQAEETLEQEQGRSDQFDYEIEKVRLRNDMRFEIFEDLAAGRISLAYAVQRNKELNEEAPEVASAMRHLNPALSDEESIAMLLIQLMRSRKCENASNGTALMRRLENEFNAMKSRSAPEVR